MHQVPGKSALALFIFLVLASSCFAATNLLVNGGAETGDFTGWTITANGGDGWTVNSWGLEGSHSFGTSYGTDTKEQLINLTNNGLQNYSTSVLDSVPSIQINDFAYSHWGGTYTIHVELRNASNAAIATYDTGTLTANDSWVQITHTFSGYGAGLRYVYFRESGVDSRGWGGWYGPNFDNASVYVSSIPISACGTLNITGAYYVLNQSISGASSECIGVTASGITLDCQGHNITASTPQSMGLVYTGAITNFTLLNCNLVNGSVYNNNQLSAQLLQNVNITSSSYSTTFNSYNTTMNNVRMNISGANIADPWTFYTADIENSTFISNSGTTFNLYRAESGNVFFNDTFIGNTSAVQISSGSGNSFALCNFTCAAAGCLYANDTAGGNFYNKTVNGINQGNIWPNVMNGSITVIGSSNSSVQGLYIGSAGSGVPYNSTTSGGMVTSSVMDYAPLTTQSASLSSCANLSVTGTVYSLSSNVSINGSTCFTMTAANVTLNCAGYTLTGNNVTGAYGIYSNQPNTTVENCNINGFSNGVYFNSVANGTIAGNNITTMNTTASYNGIGIWINLCNGTTVTGNNVSGSRYGIGMDSNQNDYVAGNIISSQTANTQKAVNIITSANGNALYNNTVYSWGSGINIATTSANNSVDCAGAGMTGNNASGYYGAYSDSLNTTIKNCQISNFGTAIYFNSAKNGSIINTTASTTYTYSSAPNGFGIYLYNAANYNNITNCNFSASSGFSIYLTSSSSFNTITGSSATSTSLENALVITSSSSNNTFTMTNATATVGEGLDIETSSNGNVFANGRISGNQTYGAAYVGWAANNNTIANNTINGGGKYAATLQKGSSNTGNRFINNTFLNATVLLYLDTVSGGNTFYWNNFTNIANNSTNTPIYYVNDSNGSNFYNTTIGGHGEGNLWANVLNASVQVLGVNSSSVAGFYAGSNGSGYPYNSTTSLGKVSSGVVDYAPLTNQSLPPSIALNSPAANSTPIISNMTFNFTATDPLSLSMNCSLYLNGTLNQTNSSAASNVSTLLSVAGIPNGNYNWYVSCSDAYHGSNTSVSRNFTINVPAGVSISFINASTPANGTVSTNTSFAMNVSLSNATTIGNLTLYFNGTPYSMYDSSLLMMLNLNNVSSLGESATNVFDASKYSNNATPKGAVWTASGRYGGAYSFNGVASNYINTSLVQANATQYSVAAWVKTQTAQEVMVNDRGSGAGMSLTLAIGASCSNSKGSYCPNSNPGVPAFGVDSNNIWIGINGISRIDDNAWHYVVGVFNSTAGQSVTPANLKLYVDGAQVSGPNATISSATSPLSGLSGTRIGYHEPWVQTFNGTIDEVRIWNRSLSAADVRQMYYSNLNKNAADQWNFQSNEGNLTNGTYTYQLAATNSVGAVNTTEVRTYTVDQASPTWSGNKTNLTSTSPFGSAAYFNITLSDADPGQYIFSWYNGTSWSNNSASSYSSGVEITVSKTINAHNSTLRWTWYYNDSLGNSGQTPVWNNTILPEPQVSISYPANGSFTSNNSTAVLYTATGTGITCAYSVDGGANSTLSGCANISGVAWGEGAHNLTVWAVDSGGRATSAALAFTVDLTAPSLVNITAPANHFQTSMPTPNVSFMINDSLSGTDRYSVWVDGSIARNSGNGSAASGTPTTVKILNAMSLGNHTVVVQAFDAANNTANSSAITIEIVPPIVYLVSPAYGSFLNTTSANFTFYVYAPSEPSVNCTVSVNNITAYANTSMPTNANVTFQAGSLPESNSISWTAYCSDSFGANTTDTWIFGVDLTPPAISFALPTPSSGTITGNASLTLDANASDSGAGIGNVTLFVYNANGSLVNSSIAPSGTPVTFAGLADGLYYFNSSVPDLVGNAQKTETRNVTIDTTAPSYSANSTTLNYTSGSGAVVYFNLTLTDLHPGNYTFSWYNGSAWLNDTPAAYSNGTAITASKTIGITGASFQWTWYYNDSLGNSGQTPVWNQTTNHAPSATAPSISPSTAYSNDTLTCSAGTFTDPDGDASSTPKWRWYDINGLISGQTSSTLVHSNFAAGSRITCEETPADSWGLAGAPVNSTQIIIGVRNITIASQISASNSSAGHAFTISATASSPDGVSYIGSWSAAASAGSCDKLSSSASGYNLTVAFNCTDSALETGNFNITFSDNSYNTITTNTIANTYPNHAPSVTMPSVSPYPAYANNTLTCAAGVYSDPDGDANATPAWTWYDNGALLPETSNTLATGNFSTGDNITCGQAPADQYGLAGAAVNSTQITIGSSALLIAAQLSFSNYAAGHSFNATATATDPNGAANFLVPIMQASAGACSYLGNTTNGNSLTAIFNCTGTPNTAAYFNITFNDTFNQSAQTATARAYYPNQPPTAPALASPLDGQIFTDVQSGNITVSWSSSTDADGDNASYELQYSNDSGATWNALPANQSPYYWNASSLAPLSTYHLQVRAKDPYNATGWNAIGLVIQKANVFGNGSAINVSTNSSTTNLTASIDSYQNVSNTAQSDVHTVDITSNDQPLFVFSFNFTNATLNFSQVNIEAGNTTGGAAYASISGVNSSNIVEGGKTIYMYNANSTINSVCVKDEEGATYSIITDTCNGADEYLVPCDGTLRYGQYNCTWESSSTLEVSGLSHSAVMQLSAPAQSSQSYGGGASSAAATLTSSFDCASGSLGITVAASGSQLANIRVSLADAGNNKVFATTDSGGTAHFTIASSGSYSAQIESGSYYGSLSSAQFSLCNQNQPAAPAQPSTPQQPSQPQQPQQNNPQNPAGTPAGQQNGQESANGTPSVPQKIIENTVQQLAVSNETKQAISAAAAPAISLTAVCGGATLLIAAIAIYIFAIKKKKGLEGVR